MRSGTARDKYLKFAALEDIATCATLQRSDSRSIAEGVQRSVSPADRTPTPPFRGRARGGGSFRGGGGVGRGSNSSNTPAANNGPHAQRRGYKPGGHSLASGVKGARNISEAPVMHVSNIDLHHERVSSYDSVDSNTSVDGSRPAVSGISTPPTSSSPLHFAGPISTKPIPANNPVKPAHPPLHHMDSSSRDKSSYDSQEVANMLRMSYTSRNKGNISDNMDFTKEFNEVKVISLDRLKGNKEIVESDGLVPESAPISVAPTSSQPPDITHPRDVTPATRDLTPATRDLTLVTRDDELDTPSPKPEETPQFCKARYTFKPEGPRELGFKKKDIIRIRRLIDANWIEGELEGSVGIFPRNYVEILEPEEAPMSADLPPVPDSPDTTFDSSYPDPTRAASAYVPNYQRNVQSLPRGRMRREEDAERERKKKEDEERRVEEEKRRIRERREEEKRAEEQRKREEEERRRIERDEERRKIQEQKRAEEQRIAEQKKKEEERRAAEEKKRAEDVRRRAEEERRKAEEQERLEEKRRVEEKRRAEEERVKAEEKKRAEELQKQRQEEQMRQKRADEQREEKRKREEERLMELERKHDEEMRESERRKEEELRVAQQNNINHRVSNTPEDTFQVKAIYSFKTNDNGELPFKKGSEIAVTEVIDDNWYYGNIGARAGIFPSSYVTRLEPQSSQPLNQLIEDCQDNYRPEPVSRDGYHNTERDINHTSLPDTYDHLGDDDGAGEDSDDSNFQDYELYEAQYTYKPLNADELELHKGDLIEVIERCEDGWFVGTSQRTEQFGTFPGNYVVPATTT